MKVRAEQPDMMDAGRLFELLREDISNDCEVFDYEERKDNARQLRRRAIAESKNKQLNQVCNNKQNRHYINVRNRL